MTQIQREFELTDILAPVHSELEEMSSFFVRELQGPSPRIQELISHVSRYRGKRLRSAHVFLTAKGFGNCKKEHIKIGAIVEMIHTATLVHDDILDEAAMRRRLQSVNFQWGNHTAVLLGDYIYSKAFAMSTHLESQLCSRVLSEVTKTICRGEIEQIASRYDFALTRQRYFDMIGAKTASLYAAACQLGAAYAGVEEKIVRDMHFFGWHLGLAFQIIDDCLDLEGLEEIVGKSLGTDVAEGKITLPILVVLENLNESKKKRLEEIYRDSGELDRVALLKSEFDLRRGIGESLQVAQHWMQEGLKGLATMPQGPCKESLEAIADYVLSRKW